MIEIKLINQDLAKLYEKDFKTYIGQVLKANYIDNTDKRIEGIYNNMLEYINDGSAFIVGAFQKEEMVGFIWAYERNLNNKKRYHINYFIVNEENRKQGIGKKLIDEIYKIAKKNNIEEIELIVTERNSGAVQFYNKEDFKVERITLCKKL